MEESTESVHQDILDLYAETLKYSFCRKIHIIEAWDKVLDIQTQVGVKKWLRIKRLILPSEIWLYYYPTKSQYDWICGLY